MTTALPKTKDASYMLTENLNRIRAGLTGERARMLSDIFENDDELPRLGVACSSTGLWSTDSIAALEVYIDRINLLVLEELDVDSRRAERIYTVAARLDKSIEGLQKAAREAQPNRED